jgi:hypothetical protein
MSMPAVQISEASYRILRELVEQTGKTMPEILDGALEDYRRKVFFEGLTSDYATLKADPKARDQELAERRLWEGTLKDSPGTRDSKPPEGRDIKADRPGDSA